MLDEVYKLWRSLLRSFFLSSYVWVFPSRVSVSGLYLRRGIKFYWLTEVKVTVLWIFVFIGFDVITKLILTFIRNILFSSREVFVRVSAENNWV
jgi:hypothetical protein